MRTQSVHVTFSCVGKGSSAWGFLTMGRVGLLVGGKHDGCRRCDLRIFVCVFLFLSGSFLTYHFWRSGVGALLAFLVSCK
jgi:hypothetical protein